jgi:hypothetical protein
MSETWELTDIPDQVTLTPNTLRAALGLLNWTPHILAQKCEVWPWSLSKDLTDYLSYGGGLAVCQLASIKRVLCRRLWFCPEGYGQGVILKPETFGDTKASIVFGGKRNHLAVAP